MNAHVCIWLLLLLLLFVGQRRESWKIERRRNKNTSAEIDENEKRRVPAACGIFVDSVWHKWMQRGRRCVEAANDARVIALKGFHLLLRWLRHRLFIIKFLLKTYNMLSNYHGMYIRAANAFCCGDETMKGCICLPAIHSVYPFAVERNDIGYLLCFMKNDFFITDIFIWISLWGYYGMIIIWSCLEWLPEVGNNLLIFGTGFVYLFIFSFSFSFWGIRNQCYL